MRKMRKIFITLLINVLVLAVYGQDFKIITEVETSPVKNQNRSGTCWSFATTSFVETELIRIKDKTYDLSEMFFVNKAYHNKAINYIRLHKKANFSAGGQAHDVMNVIREYGFVPEEVYPGINYNEEKHNHGELDPILSGMISNVEVKHKGQKWLEAIDQVLSVYLGDVPETFTYEGEKYSPKTFANSTSFNPDDYVELTSYIAYPFYKQVMLQVPDNWSFDRYYNIPIDELMEIMEYAIGNGFSVCWDGDVSGDFGRSNGVAELDDEKEKIDDNARQESFNLFETTDDHLMHITGMAKKGGKLYYKTKNSWGEVGEYDGYWFMSEAYVRLNTIAILIHKDAIPAAIRASLGIK